MQKLIEDGAVKVDGRTAKANHRLKTGASVEVDIPEPKDPVPVAEDLAIPIVYEDSDVVVVDKPAGMVVHPAAGHDSGTLVNVT